MGYELFGEELINVAFGGNGRLTYGQVVAEQNGIRNLISGAYATLRNPRMHRVISDDNQSTALAIVALVSVLMQIVDNSEDRKI